MSSSINYYITLSLIANIICLIAKPVSSSPRICFKNKSSNSKWRFNLVAGNFHELLHTSDIIVDKSLLLKKLLSADAPKITLIAAPRRWGKSINLDMISFFARNRYDKDGKQIDQKNTDAYNYFAKGSISGQNENDFIQPPLISEDDEFLKKHLAKYVVIKVDLSETVVKDESNATCVKTFYSSFEKAIVKTFAENYYVKDILSKKQSCDTYEMEEFDYYSDRFARHYENKERNIEELLTSILFLCDMLKKYLVRFACVENRYVRSEKDVLLLIDQYDKPFDDIYFDLKLDQRDAAAGEIFTFMRNFYNQTLNANTYYDRAIITGIGRIGRGTTLDQMVELSVTRMNSPFPFYGYTRDEVIKLLQLGKLTSRYEEVENTYGGYGSIVHPDSELFNPWDIMNFMQTGILEDYWLRSESTGDILFNLLKYYKFKIAFTALLNKDIHFAVPKQNNVFSSHIHENVANIVRLKKSGPLGDDQVIDMMNMLLSGGYLTPKKYHQSNDTIHVVIPNDEIGDFVRFQVKRHYTSLLGDNLALYTNATLSFENFLQCERENSTSLRKNLQILIQTVNITKDFLDEFNSTNGEYRLESDSGNLNEIALRNLVHKVLLLSQIEKKLNLGCPFLFNSSDLPFRGASNAFAYRENKALIVRQRSDEKISMDVILDQAFEYASNLVRKTKKYQVIKCVAINLKPAKATQTKSTIEFKTATIKKREDQV